MSWEVRALGEVCDLYQPKTISRKEMSSAGGFPVYGANGRIGYYHSYNHQDSEVLLSCRGNCGTVNVSEPMSWVNGNAMVCKPKDASLSKEFLAWVLRTVNWDLVITGTAQQQITRAPLSKVLIPVPPLGEQERIVAQLEDQLEKLAAVGGGLSEVESSLESLERASLDSFLESVSGAPKSEKLALGDLVQEVRRLVSPSTNTTYELWAVTAYANGLPDIVAGSEIKSSKLEVSADDILLSKINPRINRVWKVQPSSLPQIASTEWLVCRVKDSSVIHTDYLLRFLRSPRFRNWLTASASSVTGSHARAKSKEILKQVVPVPPLGEQRAIVARLSEIEEAVESIRRDIGASSWKLASARSSILHRAFLSPEEAL